MSFSEEPRQIYAVENFTKLICKNYLHAYSTFQQYSYGAEKCVVSMIS